MHNRISFSRPRFLLLVLCFTAAASAAYLLQDRLPPARLFCMPAQVSLAAPAAELALWLAASMTVCAVPLFAALTLYRGTCFGLTLAMLTAPASPLNAPDTLSLYAYAAVTLVMLIYAAGTKPHPRAFIRFLPCAGMAFGILMIR